MADRPFNEQHEWGGNAFCATSAFDPGGQTFLAGRPAADTDPSQVHFTASNSDDLFAPITGGPSKFPPYILPHVPDLYPPHHDVIRTPAALSRHNTLLNVLYPFLSSYTLTPVPRLHRPFPLRPLSPRIHHLFLILYLLCLHHPSCASTTFFYPLFFATSFALSASPYLICLCTYAFYGYHPYFF